MLKIELFIKQNMRKNLFTLLLLVQFIVLLPELQAKSDSGYLLADFRHRPPEMIVEGNKIRGPLKDILEEAAEGVGLKVKWRIEHFNRSLKELEEGTIDVVPKTFYRASRAPFIHYLGPIFKRSQRISFLVRKGKENMINKYNDLKKYSIAIKRASFYFEEFNNDSSLKKVESFDDFNMSEMFIKGRFDVMAIIDIPPIEDEFRKRGFTDYTYANYFHEREMGLYYALSKKSPKADLKQKLNDVLVKMAQSGRIQKIYKKYNLDPMAINGLIQGDFRHRPPEMVVEENNLSGPLKQVIEEALNRIGVSIQWTITPFANSLTRLDEGFVDLVPRTIRTKEREKGSRFLGPIGHFDKDIFFLVPKGKENSISNYEDLRRYRIGVKKGTHYFDRFQEDQTITKIDSIDDDNMSHMFIKGRFDAMVILDPHPIVEALHQRGFTQFAFAKYRFKNRLDIYYALSKKSKFAHLAPQINKVLLEMVKLGEVDEIFKRYNMIPPEHSTQ